MEQDSLYYTHCLEILGQSPLLASVDEALLKDMLLIFHYKTHAKSETAISPETATSTSGSDARAYRYGYGILDENQNLVKDPGEKKVYFEFSDYSTSYIFYENPHG